MADGDINVLHAMAAVNAGSPTAVANAVGLLRGAAGKGVAEADRHLAALAAAGVGMPQSWDQAFDLLLRAASVGSESARGQLGVLRSAGWEASRLRDGLAAWLAPCEKRVLNVSPRTVAVSGFLPRTVCDWLTGLAAGRLSPALVYSRSGEAPLASAARTNTAFEFAFADCDVVVHLTRARIAATIGLPVTALESSQILHYDVGQAFAPHHDFLDPTDATHAADIARRGQRIVTFLAYLNDDFEDGETIFPHLDLRHRGGGGDALYFANLDGGGAPDPRTLHAGAAPTRGQKWVFSQWVRNLARV